MSGEINQIFNVLGIIEMFVILIFIAILGISRKWSVRVSDIDLARLSREYGSPVVLRRGLFGWGVIHASVVVHGRLFYCRSYNDNEFDECKTFNMQ
jgi:hypothetical protein